MLMAAVVLKKLLRAVLGNPYDKVPASASPQTRDGPAGRSLLSSFQLPFRRRCGGG